jgi:hypothetical protein
MATTPNYGWVMPDPTDFVTDLPADFEIFGDAVDTTVDSIDNRVTDLEVITTEGDLIVGDASGDPVRVAVGTAGQVLASDGDTVEWVTPASGVDPYLNRKTSGMYLTTPRGAATTQVAPTDNVTYYTPVYLSSCTLDRIAAYATSYSSTGDVRLGIYQNSIDNEPSTLILDAGVVSVTTNGLFEITISQAVTSGWHWLAINRQSGIFSMPRLPTSIYYPLYQNIDPTDGEDTITTAQRYSGYQQTGVSGAFGNATSLTSTQTAFVAAVRIA